MSVYNYKTTNMSIFFSFTLSLEVTSDAGKAELSQTFVIYCFVVEFYKGITLWCLIEGGWNSRKGWKNPQNLIGGGQSVEGKLV